ncbi:hypothetical protein NL676_037564 [Syzygium grande]|nr:hypothetical protein NL676_037564 [Syzygium grande]
MWLWLLALGSASLAVLSAMEVAVEVVGVLVFIVVLSGILMLASELRRLPLSNSSTGCRTFRRRGSCVPLGS